jgi:tetratricopeptide (TPR) repeat protein
MRARADLREYTVPVTRFPSAVAYPHVPAKECAVVSGIQNAPAIVIQVAVQDTDAVVRQSTEAESNMRIRNNWGFSIKGLRLVSTSACRVWSHAILVCLLAMLCCSCGEEKTSKKSNKMHKVSENSKTDVGRDQAAYKSYLEMVNAAPIKQYNARTKLLIEFIDARLRSGGTLEEEDILEAMEELTPYRRNSEVVSAVSGWVDLIAKRIGGVTLKGSEKELKTAAESYSARDWDKAKRLYEGILRARPGHLDARSNLALVYMHQGHDLVAKLHLDTVLALQKDHLPGLVNLTVVCERLGLRDEARSAADRALDIQDSLPVAAVNAAWFAVAEGRGSDAGKILNKVSRTDSKAKVLREQSRGME